MRVAGKRHRGVFINMTPWCLRFTTPHPSTFDSLCVAFGLRRVGCRKPNFMPSPVVRMSRPSTWTQASFASCVVGVLLAAGRVPPPRRPRSIDVRAQTTSTTTATRPFHQRSVFGLPSHSLPRCSFPPPPTSLSAAYGITPRATSPLRPRPPTPASAHARRAIV